MQIRVVPPASHTAAHASAATVAPFRAWRGLQRIIARGPARDTIKPDVCPVDKPCLRQGGHYHEIATLTQAPESSPATRAPTVVCLVRHRHQQQ